ncbi:MAG TPA: hypothetical protein VFP60_11445 [Pseudolabrys sp.]|nr:hypothetical protein [Pseudolabrys sp.]
MMKTKNIARYGGAMAVIAALALAAATPGEARGGRNAAAAIGFGVGALTGAAVASSAYNGGYYGYYDTPGYAYAPGYGYAYAPGYAYAAPVYGPYGAYAYAPGIRYEAPYEWSREHSTNNFSIDSQR